jgi:biotin/methionine sulfoxide reductase
MTTTIHPHSTHWGAFDAVVRDGELAEVRPYALDADPSPLLGNIKGAARHPARVTQPVVRKGWLERGPGADARRGAEPFVAVSWDELTELLANELRRVYGEYGGEAVYGGSYGWASAGRFHHAQSQIHRFLNVLGGYVSSVNTYSNAAGEVILDHVVGPFRNLVDRNSSWEGIAESGELFVAFGGIPLKNVNVNPAGASRHFVKDHLARAVENGVEFVLFSPVRDDLAEFVGATWHPLRPGTDVAVMLAIAHVLIDEHLVDCDYVNRFTTGYERFANYVRGKTDGIAKTPDWAAAISEIPGETIAALARKMAAKRTMVSTSWSLQRASHGEQAPWMALTLAALLGQLGLPGGGFAFGYGSMAYVGEETSLLPSPNFPQGKNKVDAFIPVARVGDLLNCPGEPFDYDGQRLTYPDVKLVWWSGGNPFHHHQDLARLRRGLMRMETVIVSDPFWTATARNADIVLPATISLERNDIGAASQDPVIIPMRKALEPLGQARNEFDIYSDLADALGVGPKFHENRSEMAWLERIYEQWRERATSLGVPDLPPFAEFWAGEILPLPPLVPDKGPLTALREDGEPLRTPSGKVEIFSAEIDSFGYDDCLGHPAWHEPAEWHGSELAAKFPLVLVANNPKSRLHSQFDVGGTSQATKVQGREPVRINPADAAARGIADGDVVRLFNARGSCLAGAVLSDAIRPGVVQLSTGAWHDPLDPADPASMCVHGNPNVLTLDRGTSKLAQGCAGQHSLIELERWNAPLPPVRVHQPPEIVSR